MEPMFWMVIIVLLIGGFLTSAFGGDKSSNTTDAGTKSSPKKKANTESDQYVKSEPVIILTQPEINKQYQLLDSQLDKLSPQIYEQAAKGEVKIDSLRELLMIQLEQKYLSKSNIAKAKKLSWKSLKTEAEAVFYQKKAALNITEDTSEINLFTLINYLTSPILFELENKYFKPKKTLK